MKIINIIILIFLFSNPANAWFWQNPSPSVIPHDLTINGDLAAGNLVVSGTATIQGSEFSVGGSTLAVYEGKIGIGEATPSEKLEIKDGSIKISTTTGNQGVIFQDGELQLIAYSPVCISSNSVNGTSVASTAYIAVGTATLTNMIGGKTLFFFAHIIIENGSGASRDYDISLRENGVEIDLYDSITVDGNSSFPISNTYFSCNSNTGTNEFSIWVKSSSAVGAQTARHMRILATER